VVRNGKTRVGLMFRSATARVLVSRRQERGRGLAGMTGRGGLDALGGGVSFEPSTMTMPGSSGRLPGQTGRPPPVYASAARCG
jgi:hypothetical protein